MASSNVKPTAWPYVLSGFDVRLLQVKLAKRPSGLYIFMIALSSIRFGYLHVIKSVLFRWLINTADNPKIRYVIYYWIGGTCPTTIICLDLKLPWHCRSVSECQNSPFRFISECNVELWCIKEKTIWIDSVYHILSLLC